MMIMKETTPGFPGHFYALSDCKTKCLGYLNVIGLEVKMFTKPLSFNVRYRTFERIKEKK